MGVHPHRNRGGTTPARGECPHTLVLVKQPQVVVTAELFVDGFWPPSDRDRGIRRRIQLNFVGTSSRWRLCCAQVCASFVSAICPRVGPGNVPTVLRLSAPHTTQMTHPTTIPHALRPLQHTPQVQARQCDWRIRAGRSESTGLAGRIGRPPFQSTPPPPRPQHRESPCFHTCRHTTRAFSADFARL